MIIPFNGNGKPNKLPMTPKRDALQILVEQHTAALRMLNAASDGVNFFDIADKITQFVRLTEELHAAILKLQADKTSTD